jgi:methyl-accepting chemotaxis protein
MALSVRGKLLWLVAAAAASIVIVAAASLYIAYDRMFADRVLALRQLVEATHSLAQRYEAAERAGQMSTEAARAAFLADATALTYGDNEYVFVMDMTGITLAHRLVPALIGKSLAALKDPTGFAFGQDMLAQVNRDGQGVVRYLWQRRPGQVVPKISVVKAFAPWNMVIGTGVYVDDLTERFERMVWRVALIVLVLGVPVIALIGSVGWRLSSHIRGLSAKMLRLADGDRGIDFPEARRGDELGTMGRAVEVFKRNALTQQALEAEQVAQKQRAEQEKRASMAQLADRFEQSVGKLIQVVASQATDMEGRARDMSGAVHQVESLTASMSHATEQTSSNVQVVAQATEQLAGAVDEISRQVATSSDVAAKAVGLAEQASHNISGLADAAERIGTVVGLIDSIAAQTNLLALNATIEAARAGEAGKGFAVVAAEVKALATQTAHATKEIAGQVGAIQSGSQEAVKEIHGISDVISHMSEIATAIFAAVEEQGASTREITRNVQQAAAGAEAVVGNIAGVGGAAGHSQQLAAALETTSRDLAGHIGALDGEVDGFLKSVRND